MTHPPCRILHGKPMDVKDLFPAPSPRAQIHVPDRDPEHLGEETPAFPVRLSIRRKGLDLHLERSAVETRDPALTRSGDRMDPDEHP